MEVWPGSYPGSYPQKTPSLPPNSGLETWAWHRPSSRNLSHAVQQHPVEKVILYLKMLPFRIGKNIQQFWVCICWILKELILRWFVLVWLSHSLGVLGDLNGMAMRQGLQCFASMMWFKGQEQSPKYPPGLAALSPCQPWQFCKKIMLLPIFSSSFMLGTTGIEITPVSVVGNEYSLQWVSYDWWLTFSFMALVRSLGKFMDH